MTAFRRDYAAEHLRRHHPANVRLYARHGCYTPSLAEMCPACHALLPEHALDCKFWRRHETVQRFLGT